MYKCITSPVDVKNLDNSPFKFDHSLLGREALSIENLSKVLVNLPQDQVMYSKGLNDLNVNFDRAHIDQKNNLTLEQTIENIKTSNSYIMVRSPETDPSFREIYNDLLNDVNLIMQQKNVGKQAIAPTLYLFIASPNAFTPFHIDRYSTFLFQFRGSKEVSIFPNFDERAVDFKVRESFADAGQLRPQWDEKMDVLGQKFQFSPGEALHIPFISGHYIKNGAEDVSISMSIIFRTNESQRWLDAMITNHRLRKTMAKVGVTLAPVGSSNISDRIKASLLPPLEVITKLRGY